MADTAKALAARACTIPQTWGHKRRKALEQAIKASQRSSRTEIFNEALDAFTVSHMATRFELDRGPPTDWNDRRCAALARVESILGRSADIETLSLALQEALNLAMDELAIAHAALTFEFASRI
jgi:hypothetical protein